MKNRKIEDIKNVGEFHTALKNEVVNLLKNYEKWGFFEGWTEKQKHRCLGFGYHVLSTVWLPIQKHYTKKERKKYDKIISAYEEICNRQKLQITDLQANVKDKDTELHGAFVSNDKLSDKISDLKLQLHELPKKIIKDLEELFQLDYDDKYGSIHITGIKAGLDTVLKKYEGKNQ